MRSRSDPQAASWDSQLFSQPMVRMGFIYLIKNKVNGKCYVGQTIRKRVDIRWNQHKNTPKGILKTAFAKYGLDCFEFTKICEIPEGEGWREALDERESLEIKQRNTVSPNGYNVEKGGNKNKIIHPETRAQISERQRGEKNWNFGKPRSSEVKEKIRESMIGLKRSAETRSKMSEAQKRRYRPVEPNPAAPRSVTSPVNSVGTSTTSATV